MLASRYFVISIVSLIFACTAGIAAAQPVPAEPIAPTTTPAPAATPAPATTPAPAAEPATVVAPEPEPVPATTTMTTATSTTTTVTTPEPELSPAPPPPNDAGPFARGRVALSLLIGSSFAGDRSYLMLGAGAGYFIVDGLELGMDFTFWLFDEPFAATLSPQVKYVLHMVPKIKPYVGTFFRHYIIGSGFDDFNSLGANLGVYFVPNPKLYFGLGAVYEHLLDCSSKIYSCDDVYPELSIMITL